MGEEDIDRGRNGSKTLKIRGGEEMISKKVRGRGGGGCSLCPNLESE